jgi:hypothetical protein
MDFSRDKKSVAVLVKDEIQLLNDRTKSLLGSLGGEDIAGSILGYIRFSSDGRYVYAFGFTSIQIFRLP